MSPTQYQPSETALLLLELIQSLGQLVQIAASGNVTLVTDNIGKFACYSTPHSRQQPSFTYNCSRLCHTVLVTIDVSSTTSKGWNISSNFFGEEFSGSSIYLPSSLVDDALTEQNISDCEARIIISIVNMSPSLLEVSSSAGSGEPPALAYGIW